MTKRNRIIGPKGRLTIPKEIREQAGLTEGAGITFELRGDEVILRRLSPPAKTYVEYFTSTYASKVKGRVDIKKIIEAGPRRTGKSANPSAAEMKSIWKESL